MHASVVVNLMPYVTDPSPANRTSLFRSVTSCRKLWEKKDKNRVCELDVQRRTFEPVLVVGEKRIGDPNFLRKIPRQRNHVLGVFFVFARAHVLILVHVLQHQRVRVESKPLVSPVLVEIHCYRVILESVKKVSPTELGAKFTHTMFTSEIESKLAEMTSNFNLMFDFWQLPSMTPLTYG